MAQITANGIALEYESRGPNDGETILLIMGLGGQMTRWPPALTDKLVANGYRVVLFDNRDVGLSEKLDSAGPPDMGAVIAALGEGRKPPVAYTLDEMAADAVGLLEALEIAKAHIVGASMGGMIAQLVAADYPDHVLSLTSIMSTTGAPDLPRAKPEAIAVLNNRPPDPAVDLEAFLAHSVTSARTTGSPGFPADERQLRERALTDFRRSYYPVGFARQYAAVIASPHRRGKLAKVVAPTVVVHGADDPLVPVEGGHDTAASISGAEMIVIPGMGHDMPPALIDQLAAAILKAAHRAHAAA
jgi:pimeloyl-ACP methyl ester carboxylesterase